MYQINQKVLVKDSGRKGYIANTVIVNNEVVYILKFDEENEVSKEGFYSEELKATK